MKEREYAAKADTIPYAHIAQKSLEAPPAYAIDIHGQFLPTLKIGLLYWTATNLSVMHYRDGNSIPAADYISSNPHAK